jgi:hypothetical protein
MALVQCYECEKEVSDKAPACPHCGAPKEEQPPQIEKAEILESVAVVDEPEPITQETVSAPSTEPEPVATKDERFNPVVAFSVGAFVLQIARALGVSNVSMPVYQAYGELASLYRPQPPATPEGPAGTPEWIRLPTKRSKGLVNYEHRP